MSFLSIYKLEKNQYVSLKKVKQKINKYYR